MSTRRERIRAETVLELQQAAMRQVRSVGAAAVSLRGVARDAGISAPGVYRYFESREALLTSLITEAYLDLAKALRAAVVEDPTSPVAARLRAAALAYRRWAVDHPREFGLVFGDPIPGYQAPPDGPTTQAMLQVAGAFVSLFVEAWRDGELRVPPPDPRTDPDFASYAATLDPTLPPAAVGVMLRAWGRIHGLVALELNGQFTWALPDVGPLYEAEIEALLRELGL